MNSPELVIKTVFGSSLYGTRVPESDMDYKSIFIPSVKDILLQNAKDARIIDNTKKDDSTKNDASDIDSEDMSIQFFLNKLAEGQTFALDVLFTPKNNIIAVGPKSWIWQGIQENKDRLIHKGTSSFIGYAKKQAAKYGLKGGRIHAFREVVNFLSGFSDTSRKLSDIQPLLDRFVYPGDLYQGDGSDLLIKYTTINNVQHLDVCGKKVPVHIKIYQALDLYKKSLDQYGKRALLAEKNEGIDWKALMHAVRVSHQAVELLVTGNITFPRPEADLLLAIRKGEKTYRFVEELIEVGLDAVLEAKRTSKLREEPDIDFIDQLVYTIHGEQVKEFF